MKNITCFLLAISIGIPGICCDKKLNGCDPGVQKKQADTIAAKKAAPKNTNTSRQPENKPKAKKENGDEDDIVAPLSWRPGAFAY